MSDDQIARLSNIGLKSVLTSLEYYKIHIRNLTEDSVLLDQQIQQFQNGATNIDAECYQFKEHSQNSGKKAMDQLDRRRKFINPAASELLSSPYNFQTNQSDESNVHDDDQEAYEIQVILDSTNETVCKAHLEHIYQRHDNEDLQAGLLEGEALDQNSFQQTADVHLRLFLPSFAEDEIFTRINDAHEYPGKRGS